MTLAPALIRNVVCAGALLVAASAAADQTYATTGLVAGSFDGTAPAGCTLNESSASGYGGEVGIGYRFGGPFAFEAGYVTLGSLDLHGVCGLTPFTLAGPSSGLSASGVGVLDLPHGWSLLGRVGFYSWSAAADSGTEAVLGAGAEYEWKKGLAARLEYDAFGSDLAALRLTVRIDF